MAFLDWQPKRTPIAEILRAVKDVLVAAKVTDASNILFTARRDPPKFQAEHQILIKPGSVTALADWDVGAGRIAKAVRRHVNLYLRFRMARDEADRDDLWLLDDNGFFAFEEATIDALDNYLLEDSDENTLLCEPMKYLGSTEPEKDRANPHWGDSGLSFEVMYLLALDQTRI